MGLSFFSHMYVISPFLFPLFSLNVSRSYPVFVGTFLCVLSWAQDQQGCCKKDHKHLEAGSGLFQLWAETCTVILFIKGRQTGVSWASTGQPCSIISLLDCSPAWWSVGDFQCSISTRATPNVVMIWKHNCLITDKYHSIVCMFHIFSSLSRCKAFILFPLPSYCESIVQVSEEWDVVSFDIGPGAVNQCHVVTFFGF